MYEAIWTNGKRIVRGRWCYKWASDSFVVELDSVDRITGARIRFIVFGDKPEWGNWKLSS